jgi:hypothetical protein
MSGPQFAVEWGGGRIDVKCLPCGDSMNADHGEFGVIMVDAFKRAHKCWKAKK